MAVTKRCPLWAKTRSRQPLTDGAHVHAPCLSTRSQAEPCVSGSWKGKMGLPITPFIAALSFPIPHRPPAHFGKAVWVQKSPLSGSGIIKRRGRHQSALFSVQGALGLRYQVRHSLFCHNACFENPNLFQCDSCTGEELEHNANFASVYAQFHPGETECTQKMAPAERSRAGTHKTHAAWASNIYPSTHALASLCFLTVSHV